MCDVVGDRWLDDYEVLRGMFNMCKETIKKASNIQKISEVFKNITSVLDTNVFKINEKNSQYSLVSTFKDITAKSIGTFRSLQQMGLIDDTSLFTDIPNVQHAYKQSVRIQDGLDMFNLF